MKQLTVWKTILVAALVVTVPLTGCVALAQQEAIWSGAQTSAGQAEAVLPTPTGAARPVEIAADDTLAALEEALIRIYEEVSPSVVHISVSQRRSAPSMPGFPFSLPLPEEPEERYQYGSGSGFVWDTEGHIVTNNHVVENADRVQVRFSDGTVRDAEIVGTDRDSDLAVIRVDAPKELLQPVVLADSTAVKVGQLSVAVGSPYGLESTMTVGFVSAVGRSLPVAVEDWDEVGYSIPDVIQTDAPINPGNSGGVLVDRHGLVIGVTTAIVSPVQASAGIGFAVPSAIVQRVVPSLIETGRYVDPWIGITGTTLLPDMAEAMGLPRDQRGGLVIDVVPNSPADQAGLQGSDRTITINGVETRVGGDLIVAIGDEPVRVFDDVIVYLSRHKEVGDELTLTILRDGRQMEVTLILAPRPEELAKEEVTDRPKEPESQAWLGINGLTLTPLIAEAMNLSPDQKGVLVVNVVNRSPADKAGLRGGFRPTLLDGQRLLLGGDVIVGWDGESVEDIQSLQALLKEAFPGDKIVLRVLRDGERMDIPVTLEARR